MTMQIETQLNERRWPSPLDSFTVRVRAPEHGDEFADVVRAIAAEDAVLGAIELLDVEGEEAIRDVTVECEDSEHANAVLAAIGGLERVSVDSVCDRTFMDHDGGTIEINPKRQLSACGHLAFMHAPGVRHVAMAIHQDPAKAWSLTIKGNSVAVVSDGTAVLGLGDIGPAAAMPVMECKALLIKQLAGVDAFPLCLDTTDVDQIVACVKALAPTFGAVNLEGIASPRCAEIERRLRAELEIPVLHDDQHGTAIVVLAALLNALRVLGKRPEEIKAVVLGAGAAGMAITEILLARAINDVVVCDREGVLCASKRQMPLDVAALIERTNRQELSGGPEELLAGADLLVAVSAGSAVSRDALLSMAPGAVVFALAGPILEIGADEFPDNIAVIATGRADYPNHINNVLALPGVLRGALMARASSIDETMRIAAARAIAHTIPDQRLDARHIIPSVVDYRITESVAHAVAHAARTNGADHNGHQNGRTRTAARAMTRRRTGS